MNADPAVSPSQMLEIEPRVVHRNEEYDEAAFETLRTMQREHFWYRGRHRFLLRTMRRWMPRMRAMENCISAVDLGGGCGGWIAYLQERAGEMFSELALADSSVVALEMAASVLPASIAREQVDLLALPWCERWDAAFLLDVLEHIPQDVAAIQKIHHALKPGGLLFVTTPALEQLWSWNDEAAHHQRRYSRRDFARLASETGFELLDARYFMFFLSPLLIAARWLRRPPLESLKPDEINRLLEQSHRVPNAIINEICAAIFAAETPLGQWCRFPWGTSILGVFRKRTTETQMLTQ